MMAMTASPEAAAFGKGGCSGSCQGGGLFGGGMFGGGKHSSCNGCTGYSCMGSSCYGSSCYGSSCYGSSCYGSSCHGSSCHGGKGGKGGLFGGMFGGGKHSSCHGCTGYSCMGSSCYGGGGCYGGSGCIGSGCYGGIGSGCIGTPVAPVVPVNPKVTPSEKKPGGVTSAPATITVSVPADATIKIDGALTKSTDSVRIFATPELAPGTVYYYTITAEVVRNGQTLIATEKVAVEAGVNAQLNLNPNTAATVASK